VDQSQPLQNRFISVFRDAFWLEPQRIKRIAIVCAILQLAAFAIELWLHLQPKFSGLVNMPIGEDFTVFWSGAQLAFRGHSAEVYDLLRFFQFGQEHIDPLVPFRYYPYPPIALVLTAPLATIPYLPGYALWLASGTVFCALFFARSLSWPLALLAAIAMPAAFLNAVAGQNGLFTAGLLAGGILLLERRPIVSGIFFGLLCYKPQLGLLLPFALLAGRQWRCFFSASVTVGILVAASLWLFGPETWIAHLKNVSLLRTSVELGQPPAVSFLKLHAENFWHRTPAIFPALRLAGLSPLESYIAQALSSLLALLMTVKAWRGHASLEIKGAVLIIGTFLASPYAWDYDLIVLGFAIVWLWQDAERTGFFPWEKMVLGLVFVVTLFSGPLGKSTHVQIGPLYFWVLFLFAVRRALNAPRRHENMLAHAPVRHRGAGSAG